MSTSALIHRFGCNSHEYFDLPVGGKTVSITVQKPGEMTLGTGLSIAHAIELHREALTAFFDGERYGDQEHVQPDLRIALPGNYLMHFGGGEKRGNTDMGKLEDVEVKTIGITLNFGQLHCKTNGEQIGSAVDTVSDAVGTLIDDLILRLPVQSSQTVLADMLQ